MSYMNSKKIIRAFDCLIINNIKFLVIKLFHFRKFRYKFITFISPFSSIDIQDNGSIQFGKKCNILGNNTIGVREHGEVVFKNGVFVNNNCHIISHDKIVIGNNVCIGPNSIIMDHDHSFGECGVEKKKFISKEIEIGDNVWIGANCIILKGVKIGNNSIIASGSVVTKDVPSNSVLIQKRENTLKKINGDDYE